jgi:hypothetical protein
MSKPTIEAALTVKLDGADGNGFHDGSTIDELRIENMRLQCELDAANYRARTLAADLALMIVVAEQAAIDDARRVLTLTDRGDMDDGYTAELVEEVQAG